MIFTMGFTSGLSAYTPLTIVRRNRSFDYKFLSLIFCLVNLFRHFHHFRFPRVHQDVFALDFQ